MSGEQGTGGNTRQVTIDALCEHFANDLMTVEEFERRIEIAHRAESIDELKELLRDLPGGDLPAVAGAPPVPATQPSFGVTSAAQVRERDFTIAIMGGSTRSGQWSPARRNYSLAVMGGTQLDFREARLGPGITEVRVFTMWGGVEIIVPPGLNVESRGMGIMGAFEHRGDTVYSADPHAPTLRITGLAIMGGVDITVRHPGESARDARRRRKLEKKERRERLRSGD